MYKSYLIVCVFLAWSISLFAQCPNRDSLWNRLIFLRDSSTSTPADQLNELLLSEVKIKACSLQNDSTHAFLLQRIGSEYYKQGENIKAVQYILQAIDLNSANSGKPAINIRHNIGYYYGLSAIYGTSNKIIEKINAIDSCVAIAIRSNAIGIFCLSAMYKKIEYLFYIGDYKNCIDYAKMCEMLANEYARQGATEYAIGISYILSSLGWRVISLLEIEDYETAEEILIKKINEIKKDKDNNYLGTYIEKLAEVEVHKGNYDQALLFFNQALACEQRAGHIIACKAIFSNIGYNIYFNHLHDYNKTLSYYRKALIYSGKESQQNSDTYESLKVLSDIANVYAHMGLVDSAMIYFQLAFDQIKPGLNESVILNNLDAFLQNKKNHYLVDMLINKGDAYIQQFKDTKQVGKISQALLLYKVTDRVLDRIKTDLTEMESKLFWRSNSRRLYEHAIEASYLENNPSDAFYFFEKSRSVLLEDQLNQLGKISNEEILNLARVKKKTLQLEREKSMVAISSNRFTEIQTELFINNQELNRLEQIIRQNSPLYYQSFLDTTFISLQDVQKEILKDHQSLLEIFSGDSSIYSILITRQQVYLNKISKTDFDSTARSFISFLSKPALLNRRLGNYLKTANHLFGLIFQNNPVPVGRIIISPDGQIFPFEALVSNTNTTSPVYFLKDHAVSYTYSARYLLTQFASDASISRHNFLGVAPVQYVSGSSLASLHGSDFSLTQIGSYFKYVHNLIAGDASKNNFQQQFSNYEVIQLYTHASDTSNHGEPVIYFADSSLYLSDLIPEKKPLTRLIVLSACETGNGKFYQGEGVFSFNRGFASLGIPSSITNLWAVDNKSTYQITELFYKYLSRGLPIDIALQKAKLEFMEHASKENKLPYYWAASILAGKSDAIPRSREFPWKDIVVVIGLMGFTLLIWQKWGKNKNTYPNSG